MKKHRSHPAQQHRTGRLGVILGIAAALFAGSAGLGGLVPAIYEQDTGSAAQNGQTAVARSIASLPAYSDEPSVAIDATAENPDGTPSFTSDEISRAEAGTFEEYSELDSLGRCGAAFACLGRETMPTEERGNISSVHPTGWNQEYYSFVNQRAVYNRCHLIAFSLSAENANEQNLITGTRTMNVEGMLPYEEQTLSYIRETGNHVLYRATPLFKDDELVARGVLLEARSVEDDGAGLSFCVYCYNVEPGVEIDYSTGENHAA